MTNYIVVVFIFPFIIPRYS